MSVSSAASAAAPPELIAPMLATLDAMPAGPGWAFELKWDGVRAVTYVTDSTVRVFSRNDKDVTGHYPELAALGGLLAGRDAILDGGIGGPAQVGPPAVSRPPG